MAEEKILSVFIDESGDFGDYDYRAPYYMVAMVLHEQLIDISKDIQALDTKVKELGFPPHAIHVGPIIRRESLYLQYDDIIARKALLNALYHFTRQLNIHYLCPAVKKSECSDFIQLNAKLAREIANTLVTVFNSLFYNVEFRRVQPSDYKLFQVADLICTWELLALKAEANDFSASEKEFFDSSRDFKKNRLKLIRKKKM